MTKPPYVPNPKNSILLTLNDTDAARLAHLVELLEMPRLHVIRLAINALENNEWFESITATIRKGQPK
jgi:hypothetical protein